MYTITAYPTDCFNSKQTIHREFKSIKQLWNWCREYLSQPNRKVIVHRLDHKYKWGVNRERHPQYVRKIGVFTKVEELPQ